MKLKTIFIVTALISLVGITHPTKAYAAPHCDFPAAGSTTVNVNCRGFSSEAELHSYVVNIHCVGRKSAGGFNSFCRPGIDVIDQAINLSSFPAVKDADGTYWTGFTATGQDPNLFWYEWQLKDSSGNIVQRQSTEANPQPCSNGVCQTALGPISTDISGGFVTDIIKIGLGLGSGFALLLILYGVFIVTTSSGIPDKLKQGRDIITSAIAGLIFIILSLFLLNFIGVKILAIPGL